MSEIPFLFFQLGRRCRLRSVERSSCRASLRPGHGRARPLDRGRLLHAHGGSSPGRRRVALASAEQEAEACPRPDRFPGDRDGALVPTRSHDNGRQPLDICQLLQVNPYYPESGTLSALGVLQRLGENARIYLLGMVPVTFMPVLYGSTYSPPEMQKLFYPPWIAVPLLIPFAAGLWRGSFGRGLVLGRSGHGLAPGIARQWFRRISGRDRAGPARRRPRSGHHRRSRVAVQGDPVVCVVLASLLLLCLWPAIWAGSRFLVPITPLLLLVWWSGWRLPEEIGLRGRWNRVRTVLLVLLLFLGVRNLVFYTQETRAYPPEWENYFSSLAWIREHTPKEAVIIDRKPGLAEFAAERKARGFPGRRIHPA